MLWWRMRKLTLCGGNEGASVGDGGGLSGSHLLYYNCGCHE